MISVKNLSKSFGATPVLRELSFEIASGEHVFLSAPSGKGKTTLLRLLVGLEKPDGGVISGVDPREISYLFQEPRLFDRLTALENVTCIAPVPETVKARAVELLVSLGLSDALDKYPPQLSGGMKQRVALARALVLNRPVLLLDEPFTALDEELKETVRSLVANCAAGKTLLLVSHDPEDGRVLTQRTLTL